MSTFTVVVVVLAILAVLVALAIWLFLRWLRRHNPSRHPGGPRTVAELVEMRGGQDVPAAVAGPADEPAADKSRTEPVDEPDAAPDAAPRSDDGAEPADDAAPASSAERADTPWARGARMTGAADGGGEAWSDVDGPATPSPDDNSRSRSWVPGVAAGAVGAAGLAVVAAHRRSDDAPAGAPAPEPIAGVGSGGQVPPVADGPGAEDATAVEAGAAPSGPWTGAVDASRADHAALPDDDADDSAVDTGRHAAAEPADDAGFGAGALEAPPAPGGPATAEPVGGLAAAGPAGPGDESAAADTAPAAGAVIDGEAMPDGSGDGAAESVEPVADDGLDVVERIEDDRAAAEEDSAGGGAGPALAVGGGGDPGTAEPVGDGPTAVVADEVEAVEEDSAGGGAGPALAVGAAAVGGLAVAGLACRGAAEDVESESGAAASGVEDVEAAGVADCGGAGVDGAAGDGSAVAGAVMDGEAVPDGSGDGATESVEAADSEGGEPWIAEDAERGAQGAVGGETADVVDDVDVVEGVDAEEAVDDGPAAEEGSVGGAGPALALGAAAVGGLAVAGLAGRGAAEDVEGGSEVAASGVADVTDGEAVPDGSGGGAAEGVEAMDSESGDPGTAEDAAPAEPVAVDDVDVVEGVDAAEEESERGGAEPAPAAGVTGGGAAEDLPAGDEVAAAVDPGVDDVTAEGETGGGATGAVVGAAAVGGLAVAGLAGRAGSDDEAGDPAQDDPWSFGAGATGPTEAEDRRPRRTQEERAAEHAAVDVALLRTFGVEEAGDRPGSAPIVSLSAARAWSEPHAVGGPTVPVTVRVQGRGDEPVAGASTALVDDRGLQVATAVTGADGSAGLTAPARAMYMIVASAGRHQPGAVAVAVGDGPADVVVPLVRSSSVAGSVWGVEEAISGARLELLQDGELVAEAESGGDGGFRIADLTAGRYTLSVTAPEHEDHVAPLEVPTATDVRYDIDLDASVLVGAAPHGQ